MTMLKKSKKRRDLNLEIDWRITPEEYFQVACFSTLILYFVAWNNLIAASILYLLAIGGFLIAILHFRDSMFDYGLLGMKLAYPFFLGLFFLLFSLSPIHGAYVAGAYLSSLCVNILGYALLKKHFPGRFRKW